MDELMAHRKRTGGIAGFPGTRSVSNSELLELPGHLDDGVIALHMNGLSMHWGVMVVVRRLRARKARPRSG